MLKNFFIIALRNLSRHKLHSSINILGLAVGLAASILIASYVFFELSYDRYNKNYHQIHRLYSYLTLPNGSSLEGPVVLGNLAPMIEARIPEVDAVSRIWGYREPEIEYKDQLFTQNRLMWVDSAFFRIFTFNFIAGNPENALVEKNSIVITEELAQKIFGDEDAFNQSIRFFNANYKITGIIENVPINSHFQFDILGSFLTVSNDERDATQTNGFDFHTYLICNENADLQQIEEKINALSVETSDARFAAIGLKIKTGLQPLKDIHLKSKSTVEFEDGGDINNVYIFSALCLFIILIAIVNFINLVTANSECRAKEIGLRKVMGAYKNNLFRQFIGESLVVALIAFVLALGISQLMIHSFRQLMDSPIVLPYWNNLMVFILMLGFVVIVGIISGAYPAFYLSGFLPVKALKGSKSSSAKNSLLRKALVVFQFAIAIFLMVNLALLFAQVDYMKRKDLGFDKEQVLVLDQLSDKLKSSYQPVKSALLANPNVVSVTGSQSIPSTLQSIEALYKLGDDPTSSIVFNEARIHYDFLKTYGVEIIEGRTFQEEMGTDDGNIIVNEATVKKLGLENPIGQKVVPTFDTVTIIGVYHDFNFRSLHFEIEPMGYVLSPNIEYISIKLNTKDMPAALKEIEEITAQIDPNYTFSYQFIDQTFNEMYQKEEKVNQLISYAAVLAIIISMMGLFALTSFTIQQKRQEIGIRKVMGASESGIVKLFIYDLVKWVLLASVVAIPVAYYAMDKWLGNFVYHTNISFWMFFAGILLALIIAVATVGLITLKAARANPAEALKYE